MQFLPGDPPPVSKHAGRLKPGEAPPSYIGEAKGLHQVLHERGLLTAEDMASVRTKSKRSARSVRSENIHAWLEENGGKCTGIDPATGKDRGLNAWPDECGSAAQDGGFRKGCDGGIDKDDEAKSVLLLCSCCYSAWHPNCAGLCPTIKRCRDDWACPECVYVAEAALDMDHVDPATQHQASSETASHFVEAQTEDDPDEEAAEAPPRDGSAKWMRWMLARETDFLEQDNVLTELVKKRGQLIMFLPKFHCELNWAELFWSMLKSCVRRHVDGTWGAMTASVWLAFGEENIPLTLVRAFARKCRELVGMCDYGLDGPFAQCYQKLLNAHRGAFCDPHALQERKVGAEATCHKKEDGLKRCRCHIITIIDREDDTCEVDFGAGETRKVSLAQLKVPATQRGPHL